MKMLGRTEIECTVSDLAGLQAELAEIDENFIRKDLSDTEFRELLLRRKEIYESLHPETKATYDGGKFRGNQHQKVVGENFSATTKSFVQDTADKLGVSPRTVELQIQTAKNLTPEAKEILRDSDTKITKHYLGMTHYETRTWPGWHRHILLVMVAHLFTTVLRHLLQKNSI